MNEKIKKCFHEYEWDYPLSYKGFRYLGARIALMLAKTSVTPNQISVLSFIIGALALGLIATGNYWLMCAGAICLIISMLFDFVDGSLARITNQSTVVGKWLDPITDIIIRMLLFGALALGAKHNTSYGTLIWPAAYITIISLYIINMANSYFSVAKGHMEEKNKAILADYLETLNENKKVEIKKSKPTLKSKILKELTYNGITFNLLMLLFCLINKLDIFLFISASVGCLAAFIYLFKNYKAVKNIDDILSLTKREIEIK